MTKKQRDQAAAWLRNKEPFERNVRFLVMDGVKHVAYDLESSGNLYGITVCGITIDAGTKSRKNVSSKYDCEDCMKLALKCAMKKNRK